MHPKNRACHVLLLLLLLLQVVYLDQVVDRLLLGHANSKQHKSLLAQHKTGAMTPALQVRRRSAAAGTNLHSLRPGYLLVQ